MWDILKTWLKSPGVILGFTILLAVLYLAKKAEGCHLPKSAESVLSDGWKLPNQESSIPESHSDAPEPKGNWAGKVTVKPPNATSGDSSRPTIEVLIPRNPDQPPVIRLGDSTWTASYQPFREPIFDISPQLLIGGGVSIPEAKVSPVLGVAFLSAWKTVYLDGLIDRFGMGPALSWEFRENIHLYGKWNAISFDKSKYSVGVAISLFNL